MSDSPPSPSGADNQNYEPIPEHSPCQPDSTDLRVRLSEVHSNQCVILDSLSEINWRFGDAGSTFDLDAEAERAKQYLQKLCTIRQNMSVIQNKLTRLQERAYKIKQFKEKEYTGAYRNWLSDLEYQRHLTAKFEPAARRSNDTLPKAQQ
ncbi:uncharacterized protein LOC129583367 [Paramacrobiotus metropolitanus]|uniref:uncharacterized protein LOC129583367 n=1 Tax=Paramacrobiotus metropolitanus TaxID=2943436 RepID=UPI00244651F9|nr:uncharacterized protein LOC129583367 [Paramacrobiotus metropolitanus]